MGSETRHKTRKQDGVVVKVQYVGMSQRTEELVLLDTDREKVLFSHESATTTLSEWDECVRN